MADNVTIWQEASEVYILHTMIGQEFPNANEEREWETMTPTPFLFRARMAMFVFPPLYGKTSVRNWRVRQGEVGGYLRFEEMASNIKDCGQTLRWPRRVSDI